MVTEPIPPPSEGLPLRDEMANKWVVWVAVAVLVGATVACAVLLFCLMVVGGSNGA